MNNAKRPCKESAISTGSKEEILETSGNDSCDEENGLIFNLCPEILTRIFQYLPLDDRKNSKLVCQQWYNILTSTTFQREEKIVCRWMYSTEDVVSALAAYRCPLLHRLHFYDIDFTDYPTNFWKLLGKDVRELMFKSCQLTDVFTVEMMEQCVNLTHWSTIGLSIHDSRRDDRSTVYLSHRVLDRLAESKIVRTNLISITTSTETDESWLIKLYSIFPKIRELHIYLSHMPDPVNFLRNLGQSNLLKKSFLVRSSSRTDELFDEIPSCTTLETLDIEGITDEIRSRHAANFLAFVAEQKMLKTFRVKLVKCRMPVPPVSLVPELLDTLFDNCKDLRHLCIRHEDPTLLINFKLPLLEKLVESKLESIDMRKYGVCGYTIPTMQNFNLRYVYDYNLTQRSLSRLLIFHGLKYCSLHFVDNDILEHMAEYQPNLIGMRIFAKRFGSNRSLMDYEVKAMFQPLSMFNNLRYLELHMEGILYQGFQLNLPNLEYLDIAYCNVDHIFLYSLPNLKFLKVHDFHCVMAKWVIVIICRTLKKLQYLSVRQCREKRVNYNLQEARNLFNSSQSLRIFFWLIKCVEGDRYVYDRSRNKLFHTASEDCSLNFNSSEMDMFGFRTDSATS